MTDAYRSPPTIQDFVEAFRTLPAGKFPELALSPTESQAVVVPASQTGKSERDRWEAELTPWTRHALAVVMDPKATQLRPKRPGPNPGEDYASWYRRIFGEPFSDELYSFVKPTNVGMTEMATARWSRPADRVRFSTLGWPKDATWTNICINDTPYKVLADGVDEGGPFLTLGVDIAGARMEWEFDRWSVCNPAPAVELKPGPRLTRRELLASTANVAPKKVESIRSTKPRNQVIRELVVANRAPLRRADRVRGHGHA